MTTPIDIVVLPDIGILGIDNLIPPVEAEVDLAAPTSGVEYRLGRALSRPNCEVLRDLLYKNVLTAPHAAASPRAIVYTALLFAFRPLFAPYLPASTLYVTFSTRRKLLELDTILKPFYGSVLPAVGEITKGGVHPLITDFIIEQFRLENGLYRAAATAALVLCAAFLEDDIVVTV
jgi:hypothetical protein